MGTLARWMVKELAAALRRPANSRKPCAAWGRHHARRGWSSYILGHDTPDVWRVHGSDAPPPSSARSFPIQDDELIPIIVDGKSIAEEIKSGVAKEVQQLKDTINITPSVAVILVGQRRDSEIYVHCKMKACEEVGITSLLAKLPEDCSEDEVVKAVSSFNEDPSVHGILVQLPLPQHVDDDKVLAALHLEKDVDGLHPMNMGYLALSGRKPLFVPCAAKACVELLLRHDVTIMGKNAVVIGKSKVAGLPISLLLQRLDATVSIVHALSKNPEEITREADIVISAAGVPNLVRGSWLKKGAVVVDVGTTPVEDPSCEFGYRLTGDICYEEALQVASVVTPVPGGVGPMTVAMLLSNTLDAAKHAYGLVD